MKVLVTGGAGLTGMHLVTRLVKRGNNVRLLDLPETLTHDKKTYLTGLGIDVVSGDVRNKDVAGDVVKDCEQVYHLATAYRRSTASKEHYWSVEVGGTKNLLDASIHENVAKFIHCSTTGVYGHVIKPPANEGHPYAPYDVYQKAKCDGEQLVLKYIAEKGMPAVIVRPCGIYGPGDTRLLRLFKSIYNGTFVMVGAGEVCYHLVYVEDLIDAFELVGDKKEALGEDYIIGGEEIPTLNELVEVIATVLGVPAPNKRFPFVWPVMLASWVCEQAYKPFGKEPPIFPRRVNWFIKNRAFDISKAKRELGYNPKFDLKTGITKTAEWYINEGLL
jgi:nucleoside-diphosphate-sugar epimerase